VTDPTSHDGRRIASDSEARPCAAFKFQASCHRDAVFNSRLFDFLSDAAAVTVAVGHMMVAGRRGRRLSQCAESRAEHPRPAGGPV
jgi:hypothetical protein